MRYIFLNYLKMHYLNWLLGALIILSCTPNPDPYETEIKQRVIDEKGQQNAQIFREIMEDGPKSGNKKVISAVQDTKRVMSWRESFHGNRNAKSLLEYCDSISQSYSKLAAYDRKILAALNSYHKSLQTATTDSSKILDLELYVLFAESALLDDLLNRVGYSNHHYTYALPSHLNDSLFNPGDNVFMLVDTFIDDIKLDFKSVTCINQQTQERIDPKVIKLGPRYLLTYVPRVKGAYIVSGPVPFSNEYYSHELPVLTKFTVR
jgi:hypothetical protein